jgi:hypothetical protein
MLVPAISCEHERVLASVRARGLTIRPILNPVQFARAVFGKAFAGSVAEKLQSRVLHWFWGTLFCTIDNAFFLLRSLGGFGKNHARNRLD